MVWGLDDGGVRIWKIEDLDILFFKDNENSVGQKTIKQCRQTYLIPLVVDLVHTHSQTYTK